MISEATAAQHAQVLAFLSDPLSYEPVPDRVARIETHGALVFMAGASAYKIKKPVRFAYMDFSTLELRQRACLRELEINKPHAPEIYLDLVSVVRRPDGQLAFGGHGEIVEWCVHMKRFPQQDLLSARAQAGVLDSAVCHQLAATVAAYHRNSPVVQGIDIAARLTAVARDIRCQLEPHAALLEISDVEIFGQLALQGIERSRAVLQRRSREGFVRRAHGDMHLGNIVLWEGRPVLFDAIEFDEEIATVDTLFDLAFLLMDLDHCGQRAAANLVLNRYLWLAQAPLDLEALAALPVFLSLRAGVRALVTLQRAFQERAVAREDDTQLAAGYLTRAMGYLAPPAPMLVAVGGLSGTGKSTLSAEIAPGIGAAPGALHLRSDLERKALAACAETDRLPASSYTPEVSARVYTVVLEKAEMALRAGHSVVADAVFARPDERLAMQHLAERLRVPFRGLWLEAEADVLRDRVTRRRDDASDATVDVVERQLMIDTGPVAWARLMSGGTPADLAAKALTMISR